MFGMIKNLTKAAVAVAVTPVDIIKDVATLGGALTDEESATVQRLRQAGDALDKALEPEDE